MTTQSYNNPDNINIGCLKTLNPNAVEHTTIRDLMNHSARDFGSMTAFRLKLKPASRKSEAVYRDISYTELRSTMDALGTGLCNMRLQGQTIALIGNNSYHWFLTYLTTICGVGRLVPLDKGLPYTELKNSVERSNSTVLIFDKAHMELAKQMEADDSTIRTFICMDDDCGYASFNEVISKGKSLLEEGSQLYTGAEIDPDDTALLIFTSGTTSMPKAVMLSHHNLTFNVYVLHRCEDIRKGDVNIAFLPYHHTFGATGQLVMLDTGVTTVFCDGLKYVQKNLVEYGVSVFVGVPLIVEAIYKKLMLGIKKQGKEKTFRRGCAISRFLLNFGIDKRRKIFGAIHEQLGGNLRLIVSGASALDPEASAGFDALGITIIQGYGMTESAPVISAENAKDREVGSIGKVFPGIEAKILNPNEEGIGEIIVKSPSVMKGYYEAAEETAAVLEDGWLHTGDLARISKKGNIFITGRCKNVIVLKNGKNVYPEEIETIVAGLPYTRENIVYAETKRDDDTDVVLVLKLVYDPEYFKVTYNVDAKDEIQTLIEKDIEAINSDMPKYKRINRIIVQDTEMIKTTTGKVKRYEERG